MKRCKACGRTYPEMVRHCPMDGTSLAIMVMDTGKGLSDYADTHELDRIDTHADENTEASGVQKSTDKSEDLSGRVLNNTYRLEEKIGHGGMGAVYKATHLKIGDSVAIKFLSPEMAQNPMLVARFQREALAARKIAHPDAVTVYEMGETIDRLIFLVMPHIEGERFDLHIKRMGPFSARRTLHFVRCIADVLDAAHAAGIVHRDLKPSNLILYTNRHGEDRIKVLDFGIAKLITLDDDYQHVACLTQRGDIFGSPYYMSPEQAMGTTVDFRADIYSLGVITYQLITGRLPFEGRNGREVIEKLMMHSPDPPSLYVEMDVNFDNVLLKALAKDAKDRHKNVLDFLSELESEFSMLSDAGQWGSQRLTGILPTLVNVPQRMVTVENNPQTDTTQPFIPRSATTSSGGNTGLLTTRLTETGGDRIALAVLPLKCLSADEQSRILSIGLADTLISELSIVRGLIVRPIRAVLKYENMDTDAVEVGQNLKVDFVLDGSVQAFSQRVRISFRLVDVKQHKDVWQDRFDLMGEDPFTIQDTIAHRIVESLRINLTDYEKEQLAQVPLSLGSDADEFYLRGRHFFEHAIERQDLEMAMQMFRRAIDLNHEFARAHIGLAQCHYMLQTGYDDIANHILVAEHHCQYAMEIDPYLADAYSTMASLHMDTGRRAEVLDLVSKAISLAPNNLEAELCLGWYYRSMGNLEKSMAAYRRAMREDPTYWRCYWGMATAHLYQGQFDEADKIVDMYLRSVDSRHPVILFLKGNICIYKNKLSEAEVIGSKLRRTLSDLPSGNLVLAQVHALRHNLVGVQDQLRVITRRFGPKEDFYYWYAQIYARCGQPNESLECLRKAIQAGNRNFNWFQRDPALENLRGLLPFSQLINEMMTANC